MNDITRQKEEEQHDETGAVFRKINQVVAQPHFDKNRRNLTDEGSLQMLPAGELAQDGDGGEKNIGRIGDGPGQGHILHTAVLVQLGEHMLLFNQTAGLLAEENASDVETDFNADDFSHPGNKNTRKQTKKRSIHRKEGNRGDSEYITENEQSNAHKKSSVPERRNVIRQPVHITGHGEVDGMVIKFRIVQTNQVNGYDGSSNQD